MRPDQLLVAHLTATLLAVAALGLVVRGRVRLSRCFLVYLLVTIVANRLVILWPDRFYTWRFWTLKETTYTVLQVAVACELGWLIFRVLPRARRRAAAAIAAVLLTTAIAVSVGDVPGNTYLAMLGFVTPRGQAGALWTFLAVTLVAAWHRVPLHPFHRALLATFALYLGTYTALLSFVGLRAATRADYLVAWSVLEALDPLAYAATAGVWAWAAWRAPRMEPAGPAVRALQPWATSW